MEATHDWIAAADPSHYSIQLMLVSEGRLQDLEGNLRDAGLQDRLGQIYLYHTEIRGTPLVSVLLGTFAERRRAREVLAALPPALQDSQPFVRRVADVRSAYGQWAMASAVN
jgi:septal ring-binding cell division protein DamX